MNRRTILLAGCLVLLGCDSHRTIIDDDGGQTEDGQPGDLPLVPDKKRVPDKKPIPDKQKKDSCLPLPSKQVQGSYAGTWKGTLNCPKLGGKSSISGSMKFSLSPSGSPESFKVKGSMSGTALGYMPFTSSISGTMGCTNLNANLPDIVVGSGALMFKGKGSMKGVFAYKNGKRLFRNGTWSGKESTGLCTASGTWAATHK